MQVFIAIKGNCSAPGGGGGGGEDYNSKYRQIKNGDRCCRSISPHGVI